MNSDQDGPTFAELGLRPELLQGLVHRRRRVALDHRDEVGTDLADGLLENGMYLGQPVDDVLLRRTLGDVRVHVPVLPPSLCTTWIPSIRAARSTALIMS